MPVGYGDNPPVGPGTPGADEAARRERQKPPKDIPAAGPHDDPALTNTDSTPGAGTLPAPGTQDDVGSASS